MESPARPALFFLHRGETSVHPLGMALSGDEIRQLVQMALREDVGTGDATTLAVTSPKARTSAVMVAREPLTVAGLEMAEITFRPNSYLQRLDPDQIKQRVVQDLSALHLIDEADVTAVEIKTFPYAYVIYDLPHRKNTDTVLNFLSAELRCVSRCSASLSQ